MRRIRRKEKGLTLIELMVVGMIIMIVTAISLPMVKPMLESQQTRSASRIVSTYLNRAKNRARLTGRPCGVRFEVWPGTDVGAFGGASLIMRQVDVPPEYTGFTNAAQFTLEKIQVDDLSIHRTGVVGNMIDKPVFLFDDSVTDPKAFDPYFLSLLPRQNGARAQLGSLSGDSVLPQYAGQYYRIAPLRVAMSNASETDDYLVLRADNGDYWLKGSTGIPTNARQVMQLVDNPAYSIEQCCSFSVTTPLTVEVPFRVQLAPKPTMAAPMALPQGAVVDLSDSGFGADGVQFHKNGDVTIMFSPTGAVDTVNGEYPTGPIHLLIGRWDQIDAVRDDADLESLPNYADGRNFWVTVNEQTGLISTAEVSPGREGLKHSREFATQVKRNIGGY